MTAIIPPVLRGHRRSPAPSPTKKDPKFDPLTSPTFYQVEHHIQPHYMSLWPNFGYTKGSPQGADARLKPPE